MRKENKLVGGALLLAMSGLTAAEVAQQPLFLQVQVKPNIFFLVDDSGSMDWEVLKRTGVNNHYSGNRNSGSLDITPNRSNKREQLESCAGYNVLYYNPSVSYAPWLGSDNSGSTYSNASISSARTNPYYSGSGTVNLTRTDGSNDPSGYIPWNDADGDGEFDLGECGDNTDYNGDGDRDGYDMHRNFVPVSSMSAAQKTNFANWYSYYRKREYVAKSALITLVNDASERMGLATLHRNNSVGFPVADMAVDADKERLLTQIEKIDSSGGTPLRTKHQQVGQYFESGSPSSLFGSSKSSPILSEALGGSCQQNFAIVMSDGYWNGSAPSVGNADSGGAGDSNNTEFDGGSHADTASNTLADVAMHYYERDLKPGLENKVRTDDPNVTARQHLETYTVAFGIKGTLNSGPTDRDTPFNWPTPSRNSATTIDDMQHAAWNGRGDFLSASSPQELVASLAAALKDIAGKTASASSVATNSTRLDTNSKVYQARFSSNDWSGGLVAFDIAVDSSTGVVKYTEAWNSGDRVPAHGSRDIYTSTGSLRGGTEFKHANLSTAQQGQISATELDYIRGNRAYEGATSGTIYRTRGGVFGDVVNSDPLYTGYGNHKYYNVEPASNPSYYKYLTGTGSTQKGNRTQVIFVGANDGMLHALLGKGNSSSSCTVGSKLCEGEELFAYIPKAVIPELPKLTDPDYVHQYYVDGSPKHGDAYINFDGSGKRWGTALVGTLAGGGKGVFALDISNPGNFTDTDVLWDLDVTDLPRLGYTFSQPSIGRMANGKWVAVIGNGYQSVDHEAVLYILDLETGSVIKEFRTGAFGSAGSTNGLSTPRMADFDGDKIIDAIYAGDLQGNMWKFDVSSSSASSWNVAFSGKPLFTACNSSSCTGSDYQPITMQPVVIMGDHGKPIVLFGTGKYFEKGDNTDLSQIQTFYGIQDDKVTPVSSRSKLVEQNIIQELSASAANLKNSIRTTTTNQVKYPVQKGWFMDFDSTAFPGERMVAEPLARNGRIIFATLVPEADPCSFGGTSWIMEVYAQSGSRLDVSPFDYNEDGKLTVGGDGIDTDGDGDPDTLGSGIQSSVGIVKTPGVIVLPGEGSKEIKVAAGSTGGIIGIIESGDGNDARQSWRQLK